MTPPASGNPSIQVSALSAVAARSVYAQIGRLRDELGQPLGRTARLLRGKTGWQPGLRSLLISDLYGADAECGRETWGACFARLLAPLQAAWPEADQDPRIAGVAAQLATIAALEAAVRAGDDRATSQALGAALSIDLLLQELLHDLETSHAAALPA